MRLARSAACARLCSVGARLQLRLHAAAGSGSHKVQEDLPAISHKSEIISITRGFHRKKSSDLDMGRRPELKSDEFWTFTTMVTEKMRPEVTTFEKKVTHLSEHHSAT